MSRKGRHFVPVEDAPRRELSDRARELLALALCIFSLYGMLCLGTFESAPPGGGPPPRIGFANLGGAFGYYLAFGLTFLFGYAGWAPFLVLLGYAVALFLQRLPGRLIVKALGALVFTAMLALLFAGPSGQSGCTTLTPYGAGGAFGANLSPKLYATFGGSGRLLLVAFGGLVSFLLLTEWLVSHLLARTARAFDGLLRRLRGLPAAVPAGAPVGVLDDEAPAPRQRKPRSRGTDAAAAEDDDDDDDDVIVGGARAASARKDKDKGKDQDEASAVAVAKDDGKDAGKGKGKAAATESGTAAAPRAERDPKAAAEAVEGKGAEPAKVEPPVAAAPPPPVAPKPVVLTVQKPKSRPKPPNKPKKPAGQNELPFEGAYPFPPVELFREPAPSDSGATSEELTREGQVIQQKLASFDIQAEVVAASVGPAVTQFELRLSDGIRVGKLVGFEPDLAAALRAQSIRVVAPIPGKDTIGVEVPNPQRQKVFMRDLLEQFGRAEDLAIPLFLGKDVAGNPIVEDLARMPHLLIAGTTGSGKSVCINAILLSILMTRTPQQVKLILVDPKQVELQSFKQVPHLCCDVVCNMKKVPGVLQWAVDEMENRYTMLSAAGVNHIKNYNKLGQQELEKRMKREVEPDRVQLPYIVIVVDEFADLMSVAQNEVEDLIQRLAQKSRAVGMHVIVATQRPSSEVITGIIKANLPCQIAFKVNRRIDSRVILDSNGAERLIGYGDMLYVPPGGGALTRAQGTFVSDEEHMAVIRYLEEHGQRPDFLPDLVQVEKGTALKSMADQDELYKQAVEIVLGQQRGSATLLQRALSVGYTRATRLLEMMEEDGLVGPFVGSKSREVLMSLDDYKIREEQIAAELARQDAAEEAGEGEADAASAASDDDAAEAPGTDDDGGGSTGSPASAAP